MTEIEKLKTRLDMLMAQIDDSNRQKAAIEKKIEELEKPEFDFEELMPVGSVWLGVLEMMSQIRKGRPNYQALTTQAKFAKSFYHAHKIVKAAQEWDNYRQTDGDDVQYVMLLGNLERSVRAAKADGVLQNLG